MHPLNRKLCRDAWRTKAQICAIALVMASGIGLLVMSLTTAEALTQTTLAYYERYRFADVFAQVERAPEWIAGKLAQIPGVQTAEARVVKAAILDIDGFEEPAVAQLVSVDERDHAYLNRLAVRSGRLPANASPDEVLVAEPFAEAHRLAIGDHFRAIINGHWRKLRVVGTALSPEYVYALGPGALMPDDQRFGVVWMGLEALQAAYDLEHAFNDVSLGILRGTTPQGVIDRVDAILERYGGVGAYARADQQSHWFLMAEIEQLETLSTFLPSVFLAVAAFLTNVVLARMVAVERSEIGLLKAFGYTNARVGWHYVKLSLIIAGLGITLGWLLGFALGRFNTGLYAAYYRFPFLVYQPSLKPFLLAAFVGGGAALVGALTSVRAAVRLAPAEAMLPQAPPRFRRTHLSALKTYRRLDQPTRIILRQIGRWPLRSFLTSAGIGMAVAVLVTSLQWLDAIDRLVDVYFEQAQHQDVTIGLSEASSSDALRGFGHLPGVMSSEPVRSVRARFVAGHRSHRGALLGVPAHQRLQLVYDAGGKQLDLPPEGLVLSTMLASMLDVSIGDELRVEVLEGARPVLRAPVVDLFETYIGTPAYMDIRALNRVLREPPVITAVNLRVDPARRAELFRRLKEIPKAASVAVRSAAIDTFHDTMAETLTIFIAFFVTFACTLAFGVSYNAARIALSERGHELATLRVLGFSRAEVAYILLGETGLLTLVALPLGCAAGAGLASSIAEQFTTELYRLPLAFEASTFGWAMLVALLATAASTVLVRRRLDRLDLIAVLKTRE